MLYIPVKYPLKYPMKTNDHQFLFLFLTSLFPHYPSGYRFFLPILGMIDHSKKKPISTNFI